MQTTITIKGTHCPSCKALIEDVASETPGIASCRVDFKTGETTIEHDGTVDWTKFKQDVEELGDYTFVVPHNT